MKPAIYDASVRQRNGNRHDRPRSPDITEVERQIARNIIVPVPNVNYNNAKLPAWPIGRRQIYGLPGASCIALDRRSGSVAISSSELSPISCKSEAMAA
jgi:hypothetical protein